MSETENWPMPGEVDCADCCVPLDYAEPPDPGKTYLCCDCARRREAKAMKVRLAAHEAALADTPENVEAVRSVAQRAFESGDGTIAEQWQAATRAVLAALRLRAAPAATVDGGPRP